MGNVFCLEPEEDFPEIFGVVASIPPWKMCYIIAEKAKVELVHEDALMNSPTPIQLVYESNLITFEQYVWYDDENEQFIHLIQNRVKQIIRAKDRNGNNTLFGSVDEQEKEFLLLEEWKNVDYLIKTEGCAGFFDPNMLRLEKKIRMVLNSTVDQFKNYEKIV